MTKRAPLLLLAASILLGPLTAQEPGNDFESFLKSVEPRQGLSCKGPDNNPPIGPCTRIGNTKWASNQLVIRPDHHNAVPGGGPYDFAIPYRAVPRYLNPKPAVWNILYGDRDPNNWLDPNWSCGADQFSEQYWTGDILPTAAPAANSCVVIQGDVTTSFSMPWAGIVTINIPGTKVCPPGQQMNMAGRCVPINMPKLSSVQSYCSGSSAPKSACIDPSGNFFSPVSGSSGPCSNNLTMQLQSIQCPIVNHTPPATSGNAGGGGAYIWWDPLGATGQNGCSPGDLNCPCRATDGFTPAPCSFTGGLGSIDPKTGKQLAASGNISALPMEPTGAVDQEGIVLASSGPNISITGWATAPAGFLATSPITLYRDSFLGGEAGTYPVATTGVTMTSTGAIRTDVQNQLLNFPTIGFFAFSNIPQSIPVCSTAGQSMCLPSGYFGQLTVEVEDVTERTGTAGKVFLTQGTGLVSSNSQIGIAQRQIISPYNSNTQVITIPIHAQLAYATSEVVVSIQTPNGGVVTSAGSCYMVAYPNYNGGSPNTTPGGTIYLANDAGTGWAGSGTLNGGSIAAGNSRCNLLQAAYTNVWGTQEAVLSLTVYFSDSLIGVNQQVYAYEQDPYGNSTGWQPAGVTRFEGTPAVSGPWVTSTNGLDTVVAVSDQNAFPSMSYGAITISASDNTSNVNQITFLVGPYVTGAHTCYGTYYPATGQVSLANDAGTGVTTGYLGTGTLSNSQCTIDLAASSGGSIQTTDAGLSVAVKFNPSWVGRKMVFTYVKDAAGSAGLGWQPAGALQLP